MKICFRCNQSKELDEYYKHDSMKDGHLNKCKECTKKDVRKRELTLLSTEEGLEAERKRHREKYYRLGYKDKHKPSSEDKKIIMGRYKDKYPEKYKAKIKSRRLQRKEGNELHHWSYNEEHYKDVIELSVKDHNTLHRFLVYDEETFYYRDNEGNLLDSKYKHLEFLNTVLKELQD